MFWRLLAIILTASYQFVMYSQRLVYLKIYLKSSQNLHTSIRSDTNVPVASAASSLRLTQPYTWITGRSISVYNIYWSLTLKMTALFVIDHAPDIVPIRDISPGESWNVSTSVVIFMRWTLYSLKLSLPAIWWSLRLSDVYCVFAGHGLRVESSDAVSLVVVVRTRKVQLSHVNSWRIILQG